MDTEKTEVVAEETPAAAPAAPVASTAPASTERTESAPRPAQRPINIIIKKVCALCVDNVY